MLNLANILGLHSMKETVLFKVALIDFFKKTNIKVFLIYEAIKMGKYSGKIFLLTFCKNINLYICKLYFVCQKVWQLTYCKYANNDVLKYISKATVGIVQLID